MSDRNVEGGESAASIDACFDVFGDAYRRSLCRYLLRTDGDVVTHEEFVDHVLADPETASEERDRRTVELELRHTHLPKLDAVGVVEYDPRGETVRVDRETLADRLERVSDAVDDLRAAGTDREEE